MKLLVATRNRGKVGELRELLGELPVELVALDQFPDVTEVDETGRTFAENAELKASEYSRATGLWSLADDSGLVVDALGGAPGVHSARYAGADASDADRVVKLLDELGSTEAQQRSARFVCAIALTNETGETVFTADGICEGRIGFEPRGANGFGYDPVFLPAGHELTFGELASSTKEKISHRALATFKIIRFLRHLTAQ